MIGSGTMGPGMGLCFAKAGLDVMLHDVRADQLDLALGRVRSSLGTLVQEGIVTDAEAAEALDRIRMTTALEEAVADAQFVLEAVPETLEIKRRIFKDLESLCAPETILASNTSGLSISEIASICKHPGRVAGMHWVNPPELVPLVEVIRGRQTSDETVRLIYALAEKVGKMPVLIQREAAGIGLNRLQFAVMREAFHMVASGIVSPEDLDRIMKYGLGFRYPWIGPFETADLGGLDVFYNISSYLFKELSDAHEPPDYFRDLVQENRLGLKTGRGIYNYEGRSMENILRMRDLYFIRQWKLIQEVQNESERNP
jgi:3-hydroxybutyryl-CoA dehydrogenase